MQFKFKSINGGKLPVRSTRCSAGFDVYTNARDDIGLEVMTEVGPFETVVVP